MRFNAKIINVDLFMKWVQTVEKISKTCVILLTEKKVQFILTSEITDGIQVWSGLNSTTLFDKNFIIESRANNEISFEINLDNLYKALKSGESAQEVTAMLIKKKDSNAYLRIAIQQSATVHTIHQEVPITTMTAQALANFIEPSLPDPEVHIMMPPLKSIRTVIDRMKNISDYLTIEANMAGCLTLKIDTDMVSIATFYKGLEHPQIEGRSPPRSCEEIRATAKIDIKKFSKFLYSYHVGPKNVICCIVQDKAVVLHVLLEDLYVTYYFPILLHGHQ